MKTFFVFWDVNLFADRSSCATDPICKMLHLMGLLLHFHLRPSSLRQILSKRYSIFVPILIIILPIIPNWKNCGNFLMGWKGRFFHVAGRGGAIKGSKSAGRGTHCIYHLIEIICYTSKEALTCLALSQICKTYSTFIIMIIIMIIIIFQCCDIGWLWLSWMGKIWECHWFWYYEFFFW